MPVTLIATGGTIASTLGSDGKVTTTLSGQDLLATVPAPAAEVTVVDLSVPGSWNLTTELAATVARTARDALAGGADGVVVTHGTDVLEETAWLCELLAREATGHGGLVLTCAMRHGSEFGADGPRNLADAIIVAADPSSRYRGALVCANGELHHARWVRKSHATSLTTFASPGASAVGAVSDLGVRYFTPSPVAPPTGSDSVIGPVAVVSSHWDVDDRLIGFHLDRGARGIVLEGGGAGNVNQSLVGGVEQAVSAGVPIVGTTRCAVGEVAPIYGGNGGFASLAELGVIESHGLSTGKARVTLAVALGRDPDPAAVRAFFDALEVRS